MSDETVSREEARRQVALACRRLGLLHLAFAEVLVDQFGPREGKRVLARAIKSYGRMIGEDKARQAEEAGLDTSPESFFQLSDLPAFGMHDRIETVEVDGETRTRAHGCVMGELWNQHGRGDLGRFYCLVDPASSMAFNADRKLIHLKRLPDGDPHCELAMRPTTPEDKSDFAEADTDWEAIRRRQVADPED
jgi:hypothetical protein